MSQPDPQETVPGAIDSRATDQPPGYSAPFTRGQLWSLVIPAVIFLLVGVILIAGIMSSAASAPGATATPSAPDPLPATSTRAPAPPPSFTASPAPIIPSSPSPDPADAATSTSTPSLVVPASPTRAPALAATATLAPEPPTTAIPTETAVATPVRARDLPDGKPLLGRRVALDPGHGPREDLGAVYVDPQKNRVTLAEHEVNLDVALRTRDLLVERGAVVSMTRETRDTFTLPWPPDTNGDGIERGQADDLQHRIDIINSSRAEVFLSIHMNSHSDPSRRKGIQGVYCATDDCDFPAENRSFGIEVLDQLELKLAEAGYPVQKRELRSDRWAETKGGPEYHLFLLGPADPPGLARGPDDPPRHPRAVKMPGIIVEALYITSRDEVEQLKQGPVRQAIAAAYADAITIYLTARP